MHTPSPSIEDLRARLIQRRHTLGATVGRLARWSSLDASLISAFEQGQHSLSSSEFDALCWGLGVDPSALYLGLDTSPQRTVARFRSQDALATTLDPEGVRTLALAAELGRTLGALLSLTHQRAPRLNALRLVTPIADDKAPWQDGYDLGSRARDLLHIPHGPILDVERLLTSLDVHIARTPFNDQSIEAASVWEPNAAPIILLNSDAPRVRDTLCRRAVLSHELCHLLHDASLHGDLTARLSWRREQRTFDDALERRARAFAPAFLAPPAQVRAEATQLVGAAQIIQHLSHYWGLSTEGAIWHAKNLKLIPKQSKPRLKRSPRGDLRFEDSARAQPESAAHPMLRGWAERLIADARQQDLLSEGRAAELLAWH